MTDESSPSPDLSSLEIDLAQSFLPSWAKESEISARLAKLSENTGEGDRPRGRSDFGGRRDDRGARGNSGGPRRDRPAGPGRGPSAGSAGSAGGNARGSGDRDRRHSGKPRPGGRRFDRDERPAPVPVLEGWNIQFLPEPHGVEGVARQMKADFKAYPLFDLAWLVLEKPDRYRVEFKRNAETAPALFQLKTDGSLWLSERDAVAQVMAHHLDAFYRREQVAVEPPKGAFPFVAVCGMSGTVLGPPNYHDYQIKILRLHAERFSNMPFEAFKGRIRMERDEALIQKWKDSQSNRDEFFALNTPEGEEPRKVGALAEVEADFRANHLAKVIVAIREKAVAPGKSAHEASASLVSQSARRALEELRRFPLSLANTLGRQLTSKGLQIFKAHQKITYVGLARPHHLDRETMPVADGVKAILEYLEAHAKTPRAEQWKALVALRMSGTTTTEAEAEAAMAPDLLWLLREGHVIDFAGRGLEVARRPQAPQPPKAKKGRTTPEATAAEETVTPEPETIPEATAQAAVEPEALVEESLPAEAPEPSSPDQDVVA